MLKFKKEQDHDKEDIEDHKKHEGEKEKVDNKEKDEKETEGESCKDKFIGNGCIEALNYRINEEEFTSRLYHAMSIWLKLNGYNGFSKFWSEWAKEELTHASWAREYLLDVDVMPETRPIKEVENTYKSLQDVVEKTLEAEIKVTDQCNKLALRAHNKPDYMLATLAGKYLKEQRDEINKITNILTKVKEFGDNKAALLELDEQIGEGEL